MVFVRDAKESDLEYINEILRVNGQIDDVTKEDIKDFVVAEEDQRIAGCGMLKEYEEGFEIRKVSVLPECQRKGIGKEIILTLLKRAKGKECWLLSVDMHAFWEQFGFYIVPEEMEPIDLKEQCDNCSQRKDCNRVVMIRKEDLGL